MLLRNEGACNLIMIVLHGSSLCFVSRWACVCVRALIENKKT